jgi:6-phosphogluconolactonase
MNDVPQLSTRRMTFTLPLINAGSRVWILASGADKREIVSSCLTRPDPDRWPINRVHPHEGELVWWLDEAAAP